MAHISLLTITGMTAGDGSYIASGATVKFRTILEITGHVRIVTFVYRSEEAFSSGYTTVKIADSRFPEDIVIAALTPTEIRNLTSVQLYNRVKTVLNQEMEGNYFDVFIDET